VTFWLPEVEEMVRLESNRARKGVADYRAPTPTPGHGLPKAPKPKKPRAPRAGAASRPSGSFEQQHPRGSGAQGGQWIKKQGGAGAPIRQAVQRGLGVQGRSAVERSSLAATIKSFQRRHGLQVDGVVGEQTGLALAGRVRLARSTRPGEMSKATARLVRARHQPRGGSSRSGRRRPVAAARRAGGGVLVAYALEYDEPDGALLQERDLTVRFDEYLHPRGWHGRFAEKAGTLTPRGQAGPTALVLPDGTRISKQPAAGSPIDTVAGHFNVSRSGRITRHASADAAVRDALDRSARGREPESVGGARRLTGGFEQFQREHDVGARLDASRAASSPGTGSAPAAPTPDPRSVAAAAEDPRQYAGGAGHTEEHWLTRLGTLPVGGSVPISRGLSSKRVVRLSQDGFEIRGQGQAGGTLSRRAMAGLLHRRRYTDVDRPRVGRVSPAAEAPAPARVAGSDGFSVRGHMFGRDVTLHLRPVGTGDPPQLLRSRDEVVNVRTATGTNVYPRHAEFELMSDRTGYVPPRLPQLEYGGRRYVLRREAVARNRPATVVGFTEAAGEPTLEGRARRYTEQPLRPGEHLDRVAGEPEGAAASAAQTSAAAASASSAAPSPGGQPPTENSRRIARALGAQNTLSANGTHERIDAIEAHGPVTYIRGEGGRVWAVRHDDVAAGRINDETVQVRLQGGDAYSAPGMKRHLAQGLGYPVTGSSTSGPLTRHVLPQAPRRAPAVQPSASRSGPSPAIPDAAAATAVGTAPTAGSPRIQQIVNALHGFSHGGFTTRITTASSDGFGGSVLDANGRAVGHFSREMQGSDTIYHSIFSIQGAARDTGYGSALINKMFDSYKDAGLKKVKVSAGLDVGGYQWAKMGFNFSSGGIKENIGYGSTIQRKVRGLTGGGTVPEAQRPALEALGDELARQVDEGVITRASQLASWGHRFSWQEHRNGKSIRMHLGKAVMLGTGWSGTYNLDKHVSGQALRR
jgi:hypothetical protein